MREVLWAVGLLSAALSPPAHGLAQGLPPGGYYADGAYYVPTDPPASAAAPAAPPPPAACPVGSGVPSVYVAHTATMVRIYYFWPIGGDAPGFPYVPVYAAPAEC
jgi:hypothetical protein